VRGVAVGAPEELLQENVCQVFGADNASTLDDTAVQQRLADEHGVGLAVQLRRLAVDNHAVVDGGRFGVGADADEAKHQLGQEASDVQGAVGSACEVEEPPTPRAVDDAPRTARLPVQGRKAPGVLRREEEVSLALPVGGGIWRSPEQLVYAVMRRESSARRE